MDRVQQHVETESLLVCNNVMMKIQIIMMDVLQFVNSKIVLKVAYAADILCHIQMDRAKQLVVMVS
jgi:hypothetical protein